MDKDFIEYLESDSVVKVDNGYKNQETLYAKLFSREELFAFYIKEYGSLGEVMDFEYKVAVNILNNEYHKLISGGAEWAVPTWSVAVSMANNIQWLVCDDEGGNLIFCKKFLIEEGREMEDIFSVSYGEVKELVKFIDNYNF